LHSPTDWKECLMRGIELLLSALRSVDDLTPIGNPRILGTTLARSEKGGSVTVQVAAVHAHSCPFWRGGKRHGSCDCGALDEWERIISRDTSPAPAVAQGGGDAE